MEKNEVLQPTWGTEDLPVDFDYASFGIEAIEKQTEPSQRTTKPIWRAEPISDDRARGAALSILATLVFLLLLAYVVMGFNFVSSIDDVLKLLNPITAIVTLAFGAAITYYFSKK